MARYAKSYEGEKRSEPVTIKFTPSERAGLEKGAERVGARSLSEHARELCLRRGAAAQVVAGTRRNPDARALVKELASIGNNLNQLAKVANTNRAVPQQEELKSTTDLLKAALSRLIGG